MIFVQLSIAGECKVIVHHMSTQNFNFVAPPPALLFSRFYLNGNSVYFPFLPVSRSANTLKHE